MVTNIKQLIYLLRPKLYFWRTIGSANKSTYLMEVRESSQAMAMPHWALNKELEDYKGQFQGFLITVVVE